MSRRDRTFDRKKRGVEKRIRKPILLLQVEGKNKTEALYFNYFQSGNSKYSIQISKSGDTDPENMQNALRKKYEENDMDSDNGDLAFVVLDLDCNEEKAQRIRELNSEQFSFIVSNPCIEVWFLNHFWYSTKEFLTNDKVIGELKMHVPNYEKSMNMYPVLASKIDFACTTEEQLERNYEGRNWPSIACNPRSDVIKLIPYLRATNP